PGPGGLPPRRGTLRRAASRDGRQGVAVHRAAQRVRLALAPRAPADDARARRARRGASVQRPLPGSRGGAHGTTLVRGDPRRLAVAARDLPHAGLSEGRRGYGVSRDRRGARLPDRHGDVPAGARTRVAARRPGAPGAGARPRQPRATGACDSMSCREMRDRVQAYADDELGLEGVLDVEAHLERCVACRETFERQRAFRHMLAALYPRDEPPPELARTVRTGLRGRRAGGTRPGAAAAAALAVVLVTLLSGRSGDAMPPEVRAALGLHRAAQDGGLALGLVSRDV